MRGVSVSSGTSHGLHIWLLQQKYNSRTNSKINVFRLESPTKANTDLHNGNQLRFSPNNVAMWVGDVCLYAVGLFRMT